VGISATLFDQGDVVGRISLDGVATVKTVRDWILWPWAGEVKKKSCESGPVSN
jgi:hypothetical protein